METVTPPRLAVFVDDDPRVRESLESLLKAAALDQNFQHGS